MHTRTMIFLATTLLCLAYLEPVNTQLDANPQASQKSFVATAAELRRDEKGHLENAAGRAIFSEIAPTNVDLVKEPAARKDIAEIQVKSPSTINRKSLRAPIIEERKITSEYSQTSWPMHDALIAAVDQRPASAGKITGTSATSSAPALVARAIDPNDIRISKAGSRGTSWLMSSGALSMPWKKGGGDYYDKNGVFNGPTPTISYTVKASPVRIDISRIDGDLMITGLEGWDNPMIDGVPAVGFWLHDSSNQALDMPARWHAPSMIGNPNHGKVLTFTTPNLGQTVRIDKVAAPLSPDLQMVGPSNKPDVFELEMTNAAAILAKAGQGNVAMPWAYQPEFRTDPATGLKYLRFSSVENNQYQRLIAWFLHFAPREKVYARYCIYIEDDVADGMTEAGVKLPGLGNDVSDAEVISWRMEHGPIAPNNPGLYSLVDYLYDAESGPGFGTIEPMGTTLRAGRWYVIEQLIQLNTPGVSDGVGEIFVNGHSTWRSTTVRFRNQPATKINNIFVNVYHGGMGLPKAPIHYRIAKIAVSSSYIGVPAEFLGRTSSKKRTLIERLTSSYEDDMMNCMQKRFGNEAHYTGVRRAGYFRVLQFKSA